MTSTFAGRVGLGLAVGLVCSLGAGGSGGVVGLTEARADTAAGQAPPAAAPVCLLKGTSPVARGTQLFDAASGGRAIATFTGNMVPMQMGELPADPVNGRAKLKTSTGSGSLRIEGYVQPSAIPMFTTADVPVMAGSVWIASGQKVRLVQGGPGSARVEMTVAGSRAQNVQGTATCDGLALQKGAPVPASIPDNAKTYLTKGSTIALYDRPNGDAVFALQMIEGSSQLFWSTESRAGFVHVKSRADLVLDGWVQAKDLDPLKKGEMMGSDVQPPAPAQAANLVFDSPPRIATATKDIPIRARRSEKAKPIGVLEAGAQIYVMETIAGFTNVFPKDLHVLPPEGGGFWIPTSDVPK